MAKARAVIPTDLHVGGHLSADTMEVANESVGAAAIDPDSPLDAINLEHQYAGCPYSQKRGTAVAAERKVIHVAHGDGELASVDAGITVAAVGDSTITVDILKNGTTVMGPAITIDSGDAAYDLVAGSISVADYSDGDVFEVNVTISAGTGTLPQGVFIHPTFREASE